MTFRHPNCKLPRVVLRYEKEEEKIQIIFSQKLKSRGDWLFPLNVSDLLEKNINFKEGMFTGGTPCVDENFA